MRVDPRNGKASVRGKREARASSGTLALDDAFSLFYCAKKAEGMRDRTLGDYIQNWRYFTEWLNNYLPAARLSDITATVIRDYVNFMSMKTKYDSVPHRTQKDKKLSPYTIALRLRTLRTLFNFLAAENLIVPNPVSTIKQPRFDTEEKRHLRMTKSFDSSTRRTRSLLPGIAIMC